MKTYAKVVKLGPSRAIEMLISEQEYSVMKLALKYYNNGYGLTLLKRIEKAERI